MADPSTSTPDEEGGNENGAASSSSLSPPPSDDSQPPVAPPITTHYGSNNNNDDGDEGGNDNTTDASSTTKNFTINMEDLRYGAESFLAIVKPVFLTMILTALAVVFISTPESTQANEEALSNTYKVMKPSDDDGDGEDDEEASTGQQLGTSLVNGLVIVIVICAMTFVIVLLYKYRCMKCLLGYMILSTTLLLGILTASISQVAIDRYQIQIDVFSFWYLIYNFSLVGTGAIFWAQGMPKWSMQGYLVSISVIVAWQLSHFDAWTAWVLLVLLALYDLFAVLTPCGPLKALVKLMQRDDAPVLPGLLYEANLPNNSNSTVNRRSSRPRQQQQQADHDANGSNDENRNTTTNNSRGEGSDDGDDDSNRRPTVARNAPPTRRNTTLTEATSERSSPDRSTDLTEATVFSDEQRSSSLSLFVGANGDGSVEIETTSIVTAMQEDESENTTQATEANRPTTAAVSAVSIMVNEAVQYQPPRNDNSSSSSSRSVEVSSATTTSGEEEDEELATLTRDGGDVTVQEAAQIVDQENPEPPSSQPEPAVETNNENNENIGRIPLAIAKLYQVPLRDNPNPSYMRRGRQQQQQQQQQQGQSSTTGGDNSNEDDTQQQQVPPAPEFSVEELKGLVDVVFPRNGGRIVPHALQRRDVEIRYCVQSRTGETRRILFVNEETGAVFEDPNHARTAREERKQRNSIRLGLGDFIFYSILVAKAALYSWTTFAACTLSIISGLGLTLLMLAVRGHALPALPISIFLGVIFYLITRYVVEPFVQQVFIEETYV